MQSVDTTVKLKEAKKNKKENKRITFIILAYIPLELQTCFFSSRQSLLF